MKRVNTTAFDGMVIESTMESLIAAYKIPLVYRRHGGLVVLEEGEEGPAAKKRQAIRFSRVTKQWWIAEVPHGSRWDPLPERLPLRELVTFVKDNFPWYLGFEP